MDDHGNPKRQIKSWLCQIIITFGIGIFIGTIIYKCPYPSPLDSDHQLQTLKTISSAIPVIQSISSTPIYPTTAGVINSNEEGLIQATLRSCLGEYCYDKRPDSSLRDRIGILSPKNSGGKILQEYLTKLLSATNVNIDIDVIYDTHVPAYGYGKNHGWNSIIRLYRPIIEHTESLLPSTSSELVIDNQVKQLIRWHCRISHVAAHTRTLTLYLDDIINRPAFEIDRILSFILKKSRFMAREKLLDMNKLVNTLKNDIKSSSSSPSLTKFNSEFNTIALKAMKSDYDSTGGLTKWPCKSFRELDQNNLPMKATELAANCSNEFVKCSVPYDKRGG